MAWQLQYTSAASGPTGRAGFQFTAETPGLPPGTHARVGPYLGYRPPPGATITPTAEQIRAFPVALAYGPLGDRLRVLSRCVYLGRDYSGRFGNFLGHALVFAPAELAGLRPVEFWGADVWAHDPAPPGTALPEPADLAPGPLADPESLGEWLTAGGDAAYARLGVLLRVVWHAIGQGRGRLILVGEHTEDIARWIAVLSYSLPWTYAERLSFTTYSGDPANAAQTIVGTTPDVWIPAELDATVIRLADPPEPVPDRVHAPLTRFTRTVVSCWRSMDLDAIDAIAELSRSSEWDRGDDGPGRPPSGPAGDPEAGAAFLAFCRGDETVTPREQAAIAGLLTRDTPGWVWRDLDGAVDRMGFELASAVAATAPAGLAERCAVRCAALALHDRVLPPPQRALPSHAKETLAPAVAQALHAASDFAALAHVIRVARAAGVDLPVAELAESARGLIGTAGLRELINATPSDARDALITGMVEGLETARPEIRERTLADEAVTSLLSPGAWPHAPRVTASLILADVRHGRLSRVEATLRLLSLLQSAHDGDAPPDDHIRIHGVPAEESPVREARIRLDGRAIASERSTASGRSSAGEGGNADERTASDQRASTPVSISDAQATTNKAIAGEQVASGEPAGAWIATGERAPVGEHPGAGGQADAGGRDITGGRTTSAKETAADEQADRGGRTTAASGTTTHEHLASGERADEDRRIAAGEPATDTRIAAREHSTSGERGGEGRRGAEVREWALAALWRGMPSYAECAALVERLGARMAAHDALRDLVARACLAAGPDRPEAVRLARLVKDVAPGYADADADAVLTAAQTAGTENPRRVAAALDRLAEPAPGVHPGLHARLVAAASAALARRPPPFRAAVLRAAAEPVARRLVGEWLRGPRLSRDEQLALLEVAIRLRNAGRVVDDLDAWARDRANGWTLFAAMDSRFRNDAELAAGLRELKRPDERPARFRRNRRDRE